MEQDTRSVVYNNDVEHTDHHHYNIGTNHDTPSETQTETGPKENRDKMDSNTNHADNHSDSTPCSGVL